MPSSTQLKNSAAPRGIPDSRRALSHARRAGWNAPRAGAALPRVIAALLSLAPLLLAPSGCARVPNYWREDGPAVTTALETPSQRDLQQRLQPAPQRQRGWAAMQNLPERGAIVHEASYFEDPFVDKGRGDGITPQADYRIDWQDYVALLYGYPRFTLNWLGLPASAAVTPPWVDMESDGDLSRQALGEDHDAQRAVAASPP